MRPLAGLLLLALCAPAWAATPPRNLDELVEQVRREHGLEARHNAQREARFLKERDRRREALDEARASLGRERAESSRLRERYESLKETLQAEQARLEEQSGDLGALFAGLRGMAADLRGDLRASLVSVQLPERIQRLAQLEKTSTPSIEEMEGLWLTLLEELRQSGKVVRFTARVITPDGEQVERPVTRVGTFNAISEGRFLRYLPETGKLLDMSRQPPARLRRLAGALEEATSGLHPVPVDPSRGAILASLVQTPDLKEQIEQGGGIGYVILGVGALALIIVLQRYSAIAWVRHKMRRQRRASEALPDNPLGRLSLAVSKTDAVSVDDLSARLDEVIETESTQLTRGLAGLALAAAVTPLLGLLGTVTGMIETFQSITLFGTGDPRLMSGGISQALITTQLGLAVAIPVLVLHGLINGWANRLVEVLEGHAADLLAGFRRTEGRADA